MSIFYSLRTVINITIHTFPIRSSPPYQGCPEGYGYPLSARGLTGISKWLSYGHPFTQANLRRKIITFKLRHHPMFASFIIRA